MKARTIKTLLVAAITMAAMSVPTTANAQLGGLVKKAKQKAEQVVDKKKEDVKKEAKKAKDEAKMQALETQRPPLPWPMSENPQYNGKSVEEFLKSIADVPDEEVKALREQLDARFKHNCQLNKINSGPDYDVKLMENITKENENWWKFYSALALITRTALDGVYSDPDGTLHTENQSYFLNGRGSGPRGVRIERHDGKFKFCSLGHQAIFLNEQEVAAAVDAAKRSRKFQILTLAIHKMLDEAGEKYDYDDRYMYNYAGMLAKALEEALESNKPENIEYKAMPKAGSMHAKFKAEALAIAKADDPKVIDVVITSNDWDVLMKGLVPERRNIYGYIITQDNLGKICSERVWTQKYQGDGKYGKLKAGGVGVSSDFYVK